MHVRFFGTRGSIATPGPHTLRYGGNTSCVEFRSNSGTLIVVDMGTGAAVFGRELMARGEPLRGHVLISHTHWDHIQGIPFFARFSRAVPNGTYTGPRGSARRCARLWPGRCGTTISRSRSMSAAPGYACSFCSRALSKIAVPKPR